MWAELTWAELVLGPSCPAPVVFAGKVRPQTDQRVDEFLLTTT